MDEIWYVTNGEWRMGPLGVDDVLEVLGRDHAPGTLLVWKEGLEAWTRPEQVAELTAVRAHPATSPAPRSWPAPTGVVPASTAGDGVMAGPASPWFQVGTAKLLLMCVVTFGLYQIYWFYQQWRHVQQRGERVHPALRTLFAAIFCYPLFRRVSADATDRGVSQVPSAVGCAVAFVLLSMTWQLPAPWSSISLLSLLPLAIVQRAASAAGLAAVPSADPNTRLTPVNWVGVVFGVSLLVMAMFAETLAPAPRPAPAKPTPTVVTAQAATPPQASIH